MKNIKIAAFSDIHNVELWAKTFEREFWPEVNVVIIAGDVCDNLPITALDRFCLTHKEENLRKKYTDKNKINEILDKEIRKLELKHKQEACFKFYNKVLPEKFPNTQYIITVYGNHDYDLLPENYHFENNIHYHFCKNIEGDTITLNINGIEVDILALPGITYDAMFKGNGKPAKPYKCQLVSEEQFFNSIKNKIKAINGVIPDIVVSHVPPFSSKDQTYLDGSHIGSKALSFAMETYLKKSHYFIFGHNHARLIQKETQFNSEGYPQYCFNVSSMQDKKPENNAVKIEPPFIFEYREPVSNNVLKSFFRHWKYFTRLVQRHKIIWQNKPMSWGVECPICKEHIVPNGVPVELGCYHCIQENYLNRVNEWNFKDEQFKLYNDYYEKHAEKLISTH